MFCLTFFSAILTLLSFFSLSFSKCACFNFWEIPEIFIAFEGAEGVKVELLSGKITVNGKVDPVALRDKLEQKTHKKVELLSPVPKKEKENAKEKDGSGDGKGEKKKDSNGKDNAKKGKDENTPKEVQKCSLLVLFALLRLWFCSSCACGAC